MVAVKKIKDDSDSDRVVWKTKTGQGKADQGKAGQGKTGQGKKI
jgi:hypothetical protein